MAPGRLERSCGPWPGHGWLAGDDAAFGVARLRARLQRESYARHRHDTYTVALTEQGVQQFGYRGTVHRSLPGQVVVLHPDEPHDGQAGTADGLAYRTLYLDPARVLDAVRTLDPRPHGLPFVREPVLHSPLLAAALAGAFGGAMEPLRADALVSALAQGLLAAASSPQAAAGPGAGPGRSGATAARSMDAPAVQRACEYLSAHCLRVVRSEELERVSGLSRFELALQFRRRHGTSPYRYLLMRRLDHVQARLRHGAVLADLAAEAGFADQAHMTRMFKATFGLTPRQFAAMHHVPVAEPD